MGCAGVRDRLYKELVEEGIQSVSGHTVYGTDRTSVWSLR